MTHGHSLKLDGLSPAELHDLAGLQRLDGRFLTHIAAVDTALHGRLMAYRGGTALTPTDLSALLLALAPHLDAFIARLFGIEREAGATREALLANDVVQAFKKQFVLRRARRYRGQPTASFAALDAWLDGELAIQGLSTQDRELAISRYAERLLNAEHLDAEAIERLTQWCLLALHEPDIAIKWPSFKLPERVDHAQLVALTDLPGDPAARMQAPATTLRRRDGFKLTDVRGTLRQAHDQIHYCVYCHEHDGDFCSKGFPEKKGVPELGFKVDPLGVTLTGCPLQEKISEMHSLKRDGYTLGALAVAMVDNPMVPATGHRICNDCMKGCIYQKQDPVDIPQIETKVLTDVLELPWGVEIYGLLTRWNPLRARQYLPQPYNGRNVLVAGMGPAGFTMAHHLLMEGCAVVGIDGLKIEPLPRNLLEQPVRDWHTLVESLDERILLGFGGVAEYGITVRWDKNFLKLIYLTLARRPYFQVFGGVRLGGTLTLENAWELGFDHVCIALGAGLPRVVPMDNSLARGMRQANDFLMALQLTGAGKDTSLANLQVRLPAVVIGGGLTAIDTATEVQAYYIKQVEKTLARYETLVASKGEEKITAGMNEEDGEILAEFLDHGRAVRAERERARTAGELPNFVPLLHAWGGVTLTYRRGMNSSPAYVRNHEEIGKAMQEGIYYAQGLEPLRGEIDRYNHVSGLVFRRYAESDGRWLATDDEIRLAARSVFVAAGASPNIIYEQERSGTFALDGNHFLPHVAHDGELQPAEVPEHCKAPGYAPFTSYNAAGRIVSFIGDTHPMFAGSVVKAIASAKNSYAQVVHAMQHLPAAHDLNTYPGFRAQLHYLLTPQVAEVRRDNPAVAEVWVKAPLAARNFRPGQFYRLQTYESLSPIVEGTRLQIPVMTVSGTGVKDDMIRLMILQWGAAPRLAARLKAGDPLVLMGPTGAPTDIPHNQTILVIAGRWGGAVMLDIGPALRAAGNRVIYIAALTRADEVDHQDELESGADQIVWCTAAEPTIKARRPQDVSLVATDMVDLVRRYGSGEIEHAVPLRDVDRIMVMGSTGLLKGFQSALRSGLRDFFKPDVEALGTVGSPMQCMLKGVCAQCLQWQIDPQTGKRTRAVFSCAKQDQPLAWIDLDNLAARQSQNRLAERLTSAWLDYVLAKGA